MNRFLLILLLAINGCIGDQPRDDELPKSISNKNNFESLIEKTRSIKTNDYENFDEKVSKINEKINKLKRQVKKELKIINQKDRVLAKKVKMMTQTLDKDLIKLRELVGKEIFDVLSINMSNLKNKLLKKGNKIQSVLDEIAYVLNEIELSSGRTELVVRESFVQLSKELNKLSSEQNDLILDIEKTYAKKNTLLKFSKIYDALIVTVRDLELDKKQNKVRTLLSENYVDVLKELDTFNEKFDNLAIEYKRNLKLIRIVEIIRLCKEKNNEVLLKLSDGTMITHYSLGSKQFLIELPPGKYRTADGYRCDFSVNADGSIHW